MFFGLNTLKQRFICVNFWILHKNPNDIAPSKANLKELMQFLSRSDNMAFN